MSTAVVALVDRLVHKAEIVRVDAASYQLTEATEREAAREARYARKNARGRGRKD
jgi:hypothetical protein